MSYNIHVMGRAASGPESERIVLGVSAEQWAQILGAFLSGGIVLKVADAILNRSKVRADVTVTFTDQVMDYSERLKADLQSIRDRLAAAEAENDRRRLENEQLRAALNDMIDEKAQIQRERNALAARVAELEAEVAALRAATQKGAAS